MASKTGIKDSFANIAAMTVTEDTAGTQKFSKFDFPISIMDKVGLIIHKIEYWSFSRTALNSSADYIIAGISNSNTVPSLQEVSDPQIIEFVKLTRMDYGTAANAAEYIEPLVHDFSTLPGGGLLVAPNPLFAYIVSSGAGSAASVRMRLYYTIKELAIDEYWQLVESRRVITTVS